MDPPVFSTFFIFNYFSNSYEKIIGRKEATCEEICITFSKHIGIKPLVRFLFGLRVHEKSGKKWIPANGPLYSCLKYEFRMRFYIPRPTTTLKRMDITSYKYFYNQISLDIVQERIVDLKYPNHKDRVLGLGAVMMFIDFAENKCNEQQLRDNYKKYIPEELAKNHPYFAKDQILSSLSHLISKNFDIYYILKTYIDDFFTIAPNYMLETYDCEADCLPEYGYSQQNFCPVKAQVNFNHESQPGLWVLYIKEWKPVTSLDGIYSIVCENDIIEMHLAGEAKTIHFKFKKHSDLVSFVTCIDGYYRLQVKWMQDICYTYKTPTLDHLKRINCHGPIGADYSYARIKEKYNKSGSYILRQCENEYESYRLDIICKGIKTVTFPISRTFSEDNGIYTEKWHLTDINNDIDSKEFNNISDLINSIDTEGDKFCIHLSDYEKPPLLLIYESNRPLRTNQIVRELDGVDAETKDARIFNFNTELQLYINSTRDIENGKIVQATADWILPGEKHLKVMVKISNGMTNDNFANFLKLSNDWSRMHAQELLKMHGVSLIKPLAMVLEYPVHGDLLLLLQKENPMPLRCLLVAIYNLVRAVIYLQEHNFNHPKIRCSNIFVTKYDPKSNLLVTKLGDPGLYIPYGKNDFPWIPIEYKGQLERAKSDRTTQHWAFATTLWEMFHSGQNLEIKSIDQLKNLYEKHELILTIDEETPPEISDIIRDGWSRNVWKRFDTQYIFQRLMNVCPSDYEELPNITGSSNGTVSSCYTSNSSYSSHSDDSCDSAPQDIFQHFRLQRYVQELSFGKLCYQEIIGSGHFGEVRKGEIQYYDETKTPCKVAIKTLISNSSCIKPSELDDFISEIKIMETLNHKNIVKIIGSIYKPKISIVMEYIESNSFIVYLTAQRNLKDSNLLKFALDIAEGMNYLKEMKIIHRDLAARNILIDDSNPHCYLAKVSDFGLARMADSGGTYKVKNRDRALPVKWYSPETIELETFSFYSDVWSYGVTLFEIFSRGEIPNLIPGQEISHSELLDRLNNGERLKKPKHCPLRIYHELLLPCWNGDPKSRPEFEDIITIINGMELDECFY
ncbi:JAK2.2 family protein [Megaselia abdita]